MASDLLLKICGMREPENIASVVAHKPDYIGFIFYPKSKRYVGEDFSASEIEVVPSSVKKVGVFVNSELEEIVTRASGLQLDAIQLHGDETPAFVSKVKMALPKLEIIKAYSIGEDGDFEAIREYEPFVKYFLFDTKWEGYGGSGKKFNWALLHGYDGEVPFFISGGVGPDDISDVKELRDQGLNVVGVDVNSCLETSPGFKSLEQVQRLVSKL